MMLRALPPTLYTPQPMGLPETRVWLNGFQQEKITPHEWKKTGHLVPIKLMP